MNITFLGATKSVTGSNFLVEGARKEIYCRLWNVPRKRDSRKRK